MALFSTGLDPNVVLPTAIGAVATVVVAFAGRDARQARKNTTPNGHGPLPVAVGKISDDVGLLAKKVDRLVAWQTKHQVRHEFEDARIAARLDLDASILRRVADHLDEQGD